MSPRVVVLTAPAGYGKSTFVRAYARTFRDAAICDCDAPRDTADLVRRIADALAAGSPDLAVEIARSRLARGGDASAEMDVLLEFWSRTSTAPLVAFENADALRSLEGAREIVERLVGAAPANRTLAFCCRRPFPTALARVIGTLGVFTIDAAELQLADEDVIALATEEGVGTEDAARIARLSAGWPVVARLLIVMAKTGRLGELLGRLDDIAFEEVYDYLAEEVVNSLPAEIADALIVAVALSDARPEDVRVVLGERFDALAERRLRDLPFVTCDARRVFQVHPLVRSMVATRFRDRVDAALEDALTTNERSGNAARAARIALSQGDAPRAARILDRLPTYVRALKALPDCEQVVSRLTPDQIASYPSLWIATMPFRRFSIELVTYLREAQRVYYCLPDDGDVRLRTDALLHLASALYQSAQFEETEAIVAEALATYAHDPSGERGAVLSFLASLRGLQGRFTEARALRTEVAAMRGPDFLSDLALHYIDAHQAFARGRYQRGTAIVEESLRRMKEAKLPLYVGFTATNGAIFAWANGDDARFESFITQAEDVMVPGIERGFASFLAAARGRRFVPDPRFESPVMLAMAFLLRMGFAEDGRAAAEDAASAADQADRCSDPYLQVLSHAACLLLIPERHAQASAAMLSAAQRMEAPELLAACTAVAHGGEAHMLAAFVDRRVLPERGARRNGARVLVFAARVEARGHVVPLAGKELEILTYLALVQARGAIARSQITEAIWPDVDEDAAANNFRVTLSRLRRKLGGDATILRAEQGYRLAPAVTVDVREAEALLREPQSAGPLSAARRTALAAAFAGVESGLPARFERLPWFAPYGLRLREVALSLGTVLAQDALARGAHAEALRYARALTSLDPLDEDARKVTLSVLAADGDWHGARRELDGYAALLRTELDTEPPAELFALVDGARERHRTQTSTGESNGSPSADPGRSR